MAKYNFDEAFLSAMKHQQELNLERDKLKQNIGFNYRQLSLLNQYQQDKLRQDETQFRRTFENRREEFNKNYELDKKELEERRANNQAELEERRANNASLLKYRYDVLAQDAKQHEEDLNYKTNIINMPKTVDISSEAGKVQRLLAEKYNNNAGEDWQAQTKGALEELLTKTGITLNSAFMTNFGKRITGGNAEEKLKRAKEVIKILKQKENLTPQQVQALDLYGQYKSLEE